MAYDKSESPEVDQPEPNPWAPPGANGAQTGSIGTGATGLALLLGDQPSSGTAEGMIALLPDPSHLFGRVANVLGFQLDLSAVWTWGLALVVLSVLLNVYSFALRYQYATKVEREYAAWKAAKAAREAKEKGAVAQAQARGFVGGDA